MMLRHALATLAYRAKKPLQGAPPEFAHFQIAPGSRTPEEILAHMGDLMDWALACANGAEVWHDSRPLGWDEEVSRFFAGLAALDCRLADPAPLHISSDVLFQGPIADALTHVGQIAMLRRLAGEPIRPENYARAEIQSGRVGMEQPAPRREFD